MFKYPVVMMCSTFSSAPYVHLQLAIRRKNFPNVPCVVIDDCSYQTKILLTLCEHYDAYFLTGEERQGHLAGDLQAHRMGLAWAKHMGAEYLVKISRRLVPLYNHFPDFLKIVENTGHLPTYAGTDNHFSYPLRSECWAMRVPDWYPIRQDILGVSRVAAEFTLHEHALRLGKIGPDWGLCAENRLIRKENVLWHENASHEEYARVAQSLGLSYEAADFADVNSGLGLGNEKWRFAPSGMTLPAPKGRPNPAKTQAKLQQGRIEQPKNNQQVKSKEKPPETWPPRIKRIVIPESTRLADAAPVPVRKPAPEKGPREPLPPVQTIHGENE